MSKLLENLYINLTIGMQSVYYLWSQKQSLYLLFPHEYE